MNTRANIQIGSNHPCFIIAEAGVNHNGDFQLAKELVHAARATGADAVKFQTFITEKLATPNAFMAPYQKQNLAVEQSQFEMLKKLELRFEQFAELKAYADQQGILFLSTPSDEESADFLEHLHLPAFKIGSGEVTNLPFLKHIAQKKKLIILSTGMSTLGEVEAAVRAIEEEDCRDLVLLHCVSNYPAKAEECNLRVMDTLAAAFQYPVGFSDHTIGIEIALAAVARGACVIEKHFTLNQNLPGPDHKASTNPTEFARMVKSIRNVEQALGNGIKQPTASEMQTKQVVQKVIVSTRSIQAGAIITDKDIALKRSSNGLSSMYLPLVLGKKAVVDIAENQMIRLDMVR